MAVKRKYQGPPYISGKTELAGKRAMSVGMLRQLGIMCLQSVDTMPPKGLNPLPYLELHNLKATERWLLVHLPDLYPSASSMPQGFIQLDLQGHHTERYDWSIVSEIGRMAKPKPKDEPSAAELSEESDANKKEDETDEKNANNSEDTCTLKSLCSSKTALENEGYPMTGVRLDALEGTNEGYAIDCEMCLAGQTQVLTRIAVLRFSDGAHILDQLVKPDEEITDYVTQYSGITAEMLKDVDFRLGDVHEWLRTHIGKSDVLIGHSLNNDLKVLNVTHDNIVDTASLFPHYLGPSYHSSLRYLARKFLNTEIQTKDEIGHNPIEDAATCERLVRWSMEHGRAYSLIDTNATSAFSTYLTNTESVKSTIIGPEQPFWDADGTGSHLVESDIPKCVELTLKSLETSQYVCTTLSTADHTQLSQQSDLLAKQAPSKTSITVCFGTNYDSRTQIQELRQRKTTFSKEFRTQKWDSIQDPWTSEDDSLLKNSVKKLGTGFASLKITVDPQDMEEWPEAVKRKVCPNNELEGVKQKATESTTESTTESALSNGTKADADN